MPTACGQGADDDVLCNLLHKQSALALLHYTMHCTITTRSQALRAEQQKLSERLLEAERRHVDALADAQALQQQVDAHARELGALQDKLRAAEEGAATAQGRVAALEVRHGRVDVIAPFFFLPVHASLCCVVVVMHTQPPPGTIRTPVTLRGQCYLCSVHAPRSHTYPHHHGLTGAGGASCSASSRCRAVCHGC